MSGHITGFWIIDIALKISAWDFPLYLPSVRQQNIGNKLH